MNHHPTNLPGRKGGREVLPPDMPDEPLPPFRHWVAADYAEEDDLAPARGFFHGLAIAGVFWIVVAAGTLVWFSL